MKTLTAVLTAAALLTMTGVASASMELATQHKCTTCHAVDKKMVGPSYKDVAAKYKGVADADKVLVQSITKGVKDKFGKIPMPAQSTVSEADAAALAKWILSQ